MPINVDVAIYGSLAKLAGGKHIATLDVELKSGTRMEDLLERFKIPPEEKSFVFINAVLCDVPGMNASAKELLKDGDHIGIFSQGYMWPYQYRDGMPMSDSLREAMREFGAMHHTYTKK
jgi:hypothetical protein